jgi:hypothetical protein
MNKSAAEKVATHIIKFFAFSKDRNTYSVQTLDQRLCSCSFLNRYGGSMHSIQRDVTVSNFEAWHLSPRPTNKGTIKLTLCQLQRYGQHNTNLETERLLKPLE